MSAYCRYTAEVIKDKNKKASKKVLKEFYDLMCNHVMDAVMCDLDDVLSTGQFEGDCNISVCRYKNNEDVLNFAKEHNVKIEFVGFCEERWWDSYLLIKPDGTFEESEGESEDSENIEDAMRWELENCESSKNVDDLKDNINAREISDDIKKMYLEIVDELIENEFPELAESKITEKSGFVIDDGVLQEYSGTSSEVIIPDSVIEIGEEAFYEKETIKSVIIPNSVQKIGNSAFFGCSSLISVKIPDSVTEIGNSAFGSCSSLTKLTIPKSVTSIGSRTLWDCSSLIEIKVSKDNKVYDSRNDCNAIIKTETNMMIAGCQSTIIPNTVNSIVEAFSRIKSINKIVLPDSLTIIGKYAFADCDSLKSINIPKSVTQIGSGAFDGCRNLKTITLPDSVTYIGESAFSNCNSLKSINIPNSVRKIKENAFSDCESLESIEIPDSVESIGLFNNCGGLFQGCTSLKSARLPVAAQYLERTFSLCSSLKSFTVPDSVTSIEHTAFECCRSLVNIIIPDSVTNIGYRAFYDCSSLETINIPKSVKKIDDGAFEGCSTLKSVIIPNSVTFIGEKAFKDCESLEEIVIPDSVVSIGKGVFDGCKKVKFVCSEKINKKLKKQNKKN